MDGERGRDQAPDEGGASDSVEHSALPGETEPDVAIEPEHEGNRADAATSSDQGKDQASSAVSGALSDDKSRSYSSDDWEQDSESPSADAAPSANPWVTGDDADAPRTAREAVLARRAASRQERPADDANACDAPQRADEEPSADDDVATRGDDGVGPALDGDEGSPEDEDSGVAAAGAAGMQPSPAPAAASAGDATARTEAAAEDGWEAQRQRLLQLVWERVVPAGEATLPRAAVLRVVQEDPVVGRCMAQGRGPASMAPAYGAPPAWDGEHESGGGDSPDTGEPGKGPGPTPAGQPHPRPPTRAQVLHCLFLGSEAQLGYPEFAALFRAAPAPGPAGSGAPQDRALRSRLAVGDLRARALEAAEAAWADASASALLSGGHGASPEDNAARVAAVCNVFFAAPDLARVLEDVAAGGGEAPWHGAKGGPEAERRARKAVQNAAAGMVVGRFGRAAVTGGLDLSALSLSSLPSAALRAGPLHSLLLADNRLTALPDGLHTLPGLHTLRAPRNGLRGLPSSLCECPALRFLDVSQVSVVVAAGRGCLTLSDYSHSLPSPSLQNALVALPDAVGRLRSLAHLNVSGNAMTTLPSSLADLSALQVLAVHDNPLDAELAAHAELGLTALFAYLRALRQLRDAGGFQVRQQPSPPHFLPAALLTLTHNAQDPTEARRALSELRDACVDDVASGLLRERWSAAATSRSLLLARLCLQEIPTDRVPAVEGLSVLDVGGNPLADLPAPLLAAHPALSTLRAPRCRLSGLPPALSRLRFLQVLDVSGNALEAVPPAVVRLPSLRILDVSDNAITALPRRLGRRARPLQVLAVHGNPVVAGTARAVARAAADSEGESFGEGPSDIVALMATRGVAAGLRVIAAGACDGRARGAAATGLEGDGGSVGHSEEEEEEKEWGDDRQNLIETGDEDEDESPPPWLGLPRLGAASAESAGGHSAADGSGGPDEEAAARATAAHRSSSVALSLAGLGIERVPPALFQCSQLAELSLARNGLEVRGGRDPAWACFAPLLTPVMLATDCAPQPRVPARHEAPRPGREPAPGRRVPPRRGQAARAAGAGPVGQPLGPGAGPRVLAGCTVRAGPVGEPDLGAAAAPRGLAEPDGTWHALPLLAAALLCDRQRLDRLSDAGAGTARKPAAEEGV